MANAHFVQDLIPVRVDLAAFPHQDVALFNHPVLTTRYQRSNFRAGQPIVATHVLICRSLVSMDDDLVPVSRRVVSRQLMRTHEAQNIRVVLIQKLGIFVNRAQSTPAKFRHQRSDCTLHR